MAAQSIPSTPIPFGGICAPSWFDLVIRKVRKTLLSEEEKRVLLLVEFGSATFGAPLLAAENIDDLDQRIDVGLEDPALNNYHQLLGGTVLNSKLLQPIASGQAADIDEDRIASLGFGSPHLIIRAHHLQVHIIQALVGVINKTPTDSFQTLMEKAQQREREPLWYLSEPKIPPILGGLLLDCERGVLCSEAYLHAIFNQITPEPWLSLAIAERWVKGLKSFLRLLASVPSMDVPVEIVPMDERLDLPRLAAEAKAAHQKTTALIADAKAAGLAAFPPGIPADDD